MSGPLLRFEVTLDTDPSKPTLSVADVTAPSSAPQYGPMPLPTGGPPYTLVVGPADDAHAELTIRPAPATPSFDPSVTSGRSVLSLRTFITDQRFNTRDDTNYVLRFKNESLYYVAEDLQITAVLVEPDPKAPILQLPDKNAALELIPNEQRIPCIEPGKERDVAFAIVSRGVRAGLYPIKISLTCRLLYWDGRETSVAYLQELPVQGPDLCFDLPRGDSPAYLPRQPSVNLANAERNSTMSENKQAIHVAPIHAHRPRHRVLHHINRHIDLPGGGHLEVGYRLVKGHRVNPEDCNCCYGLKPNTDEVESYFSTQDTAALEVRLHNDSKHSLKHIRVNNVEILQLHEKHSLGPVVNQKLPDGNPLFEIVPGEIYYGHLSPGERESKYLSLITRGIEEGHYCVQMDIRYDVEQCTVTVDLPLTVQPD